MFASERKRLLAQLREAELCLGIVRRLLDTLMSDELMEEADRAQIKADAKNEYVPVAVRANESCSAMQADGQPHSRVHNPIHDAEVERLFRLGLVNDEIALRIGIDPLQVQTVLAWLRRNGRIENRYRTSIHQNKHDQLTRMKAI